MVCQLSYYILRVEITYPFFLLGNMFYRSFYIYFIRIINTIYIYIFHWINWFSLNIVDLSVLTFSVGDYEKSSGKASCISLLAGQRLCASFLQISVPLLSLSTPEKWREFLLICKKDFAIFSHSQHRRWVHGKAAWIHFHTCIHTFRSTKTHTGMVFGRWEDTDDHPHRNREFTWLHTDSNLSSRINKASWSCEVASLAPPLHKIYYYQYWRWNKNWYTYVNKMHVCICCSLETENQENLYCSCGLTICSHNWSGMPYCATMNVPKIHTFSPHQPALPFTWHLPTEKGKV